MRGGWVFATFPRWKMNNLPLLAWIPLCAFTRSRCTLCSTRFDRQRKQMRKHFHHAFRGECNKSKRKLPSNYVIHLRACNGAVFLGSYPESFLSLSRLECVRGRKRIGLRIHSCVLQFTMDSNDRKTPSRQRSTGNEQTRVTTFFPLWQTLLLNWERFSSGSAIIPTRLPLICRWSEVKHIYRLPSSLHLLMPVVCLASHSTLSTPRQCSRSKYKEHLFTLNWMRHALEQPLKYIASHE